MSEWVRRQWAGHAAVGRQGHLHRLMGCIAASPSVGNASTLTPPPSLMPPSVLDFGAFCCLQLVISRMRFTVSAAVSPSMEPAALMSSKPSWSRSFSILRFIEEFQWFLIALSVLPGRSLAISAQRFPSLECASRMIWSSSSLQGSLRMSGSRWLCQRSRHCLPMRPGSLAAITDHFLGPNSLTSSTTLASSCM